MPSSRSDRSTPDPLNQIEAQLQQLQALYELAKQSEQFKGGFLARTSHELRSPLNSVMSLLQLILSDLCEDADEEREFVAQAYAASQKMLGLLDKMVGISKASYGTEPLQIQPVCLEDVFMEMESMTLMQAQNRSQRLTIAYPASDVWVMADPRWFRQVLVSLVDTPMRLMQEGEIQVTTQTDTAKGTVQIQICDQRPISFWYEPIDLLQTFQQRGLITQDTNPTHWKSSLKSNLAALEAEPMPSPGLSLFVNQSILELMQGRLEVLAIAPQEDAEPADPFTTLIQCVIPLAHE